MERDFLGLAVKQETPDESIDAVPLTSSTMHWPLPNKACTVPNLLSFQEDMAMAKSGFGSLSSIGLVAITTEVLDSDHNAYVGPQVRHATASYPAMHNGSHTHRMITNQANLKSAHRSFIGTSGPNPIGSLSLGSQPPLAKPSSSRASGSADLRNGSHIPGAPTQLTIFYNGSVCVYDNISPDKAQAIMLLAGNSPPLPSTTALRPPVVDPFTVSQAYGLTSHRSSPICVTPLSIAPPAVHSCPKNEAIAAKPTQVFMSSSVIAEPLRATKSSIGSVSAKFLSSDTVPQFRKKSLARFLEKRKERVISAAPYAVKESPDCR